MKYIRTENGVFEVVDENDRYYKCCSGDGYLTLAAKFDNDVNGVSKALKSADTIEELIDNYVFIEKGKMPVDFDKETITFNVGICLEDKTIVYGAIWTDKGLIYVAKMNKEGALELI